MMQKNKDMKINKREMVEWLYVVRNTLIEMENKLGRMEQRIGFDINKKGGEGDVYDIYKECKEKYEDYFNFMRKQPNIKT